MKIAVIGAGYVGLVTAACFADQGITVLCLDNQSRKITDLKRGLIPIHEIGLKQLIARHQASAQLTFSSAPSDVKTADAVFLAVGTPATPSGEADLSAVFATARDLTPYMKPGVAVVTKSTVPVGTNRALRKIIADRRPMLDFSIVSNPEFLREGSAIADFRSPDRLVIGHEDQRGRAMLIRLYRQQIKQGVPLLCTTLENAELTKYVANAFLAMKIAFINEVADLCEATGGDVADVARGIGLDKRIGPHFLSPGPGFSGSCFPKDTRAYAATGRKFGRPQQLIETVIHVNDTRKRAIADHILAELGPYKAGRRVALLGVTFKAGTDDIREAPALSIVPVLQASGIKITAYDPQSEAARHHPALNAVKWTDDPYDAADGAEAVVLLTEWPAFRRLQTSKLRARMTGRLLFDYRNLLDSDAVTGVGLTYIGVGSAVQKGKPASRPAAALERAKGMLQSPAESLRSPPQVPILQES